MPIAVVTDAQVIQEFYKRELGRETRWFPYGTDLYPRGHRMELVERLGLRPDRYLLYVSRMEPENNALLVVEAYGALDTDVPLVMVGDAPYAHRYMEKVRAAAGPKVRFLGYRFGDEYHALGANALAYVQATEVGGTHPALVEALGHRNAVIAHDVPEHREVVGDAGVFFQFRDRNELTIRMRELINRPDEVDRLRNLAGERAESRYSWDAVTDAYLSYFGELLKR
jgi:glycosyltransferase involved in cell wall biosynthesis